MPPAGAARLPTALLIAALAGCATPAERRAEPEAPGARRLLVVQAAEGPVRAVVHGPLLDLEPEARDRLVTEAMAAGVRGLRVRFTTDPTEAAAPEPHLAVVLGAVPPAPATLACRAPEEMPVAAAGLELRVLAVFCDGPEPLAESRTEGPVSGPDDRRLRRLLWRSANQLFPDDYAETYGFGILPDWLGVGVEGSFGF
jgi:hypothetical protein